MRIGNAIYRISRAAKTFATSCIPGAFVLPLADRCLSARNRLLERSRQLESRKRGDGGLSHVLDFAGVALSRSILERDEPWGGFPTPQPAAPGMLTEAEKRYYQYIARFVDGSGSVVEVGTWLGMSTFFLAKGLEQNPRFNGKLHCFDDFVWRSSSMTKWVSDLDLDAPGNYESFQPLFERYLLESNIRDLVDVNRMKVADYFGNDDIAPLIWDRGPIELCVIDCGRTLEVNEGWYKILSPSFVPNRTLVVMQDWQNHKAVPERFWENTRIFTESKGEALDLVHEVRDAGIATFLYRGIQSPR